MTQPQEPVEAQGLSDAALAAMTAAFAGVVLSAVTEWLTAAGAAVLGAFRRTGRIDTTILTGLDGVWSRIVDDLMPDLMRAARRGWEETAAQLGLDVPFNPRDPILIEQLERTRNLLVRVDDQVYASVIKAIADGTDRGESKDRIAERISNVLSATGSENWPNRAHVIAVTEVGRFTEAGGLAAAQRFQVRTARQLSKTWVDKDDDRVRLSHRRVDGITLRLGQLFEVGGSMLRYPKDPAGLASDVIACRCRLHIREVRRG